jgi:hypothetical protein
MFHIWKESKLDTYPYSSREDYNSDTYRKKQTVSHIILTFFPPPTTGTAGFNSDHACDHILVAQSLPPCYMSQGLHGMDVVSDDKLQGVIQLELTGSYRSRRVPGDYGPVPSSQFLCI